MLKSQPPLQDDEEFVSYDVESLFTNVPVRETVDYIMDKIYKEEKLPIIATKLTFKRLLQKLLTENIFMLNDNFYQQTDGCTMGGPLSVICANIFMTKMEEEIVNAENPRFYKRFIDNSINRRKKNEADKLFERLNNYHPKIRFTIEAAPRKFLDTAIKYDDQIVTSVHRNVNKVPVHWSLKVPKKYKRNAVNADLHRAQRISLDMEKEKAVITAKFVKAEFPKRFIASIIKHYEERKDELDEMIIPQNFFDEPKK